MDKYELRPHPLRPVWLWLAVLVIPVSIGMLFLHEVGMGLWGIFLGCLFLTFYFTRKWKRKIDS